VLLRYMLTSPDFADSHLDPIQLQNGPFCSTSLVTLHRPDSAALCRRVTAPDSDPVHPHSPYARAATWRSPRRHASQTHAAVFSARADLVRTCRRHSQRRQQRNNPLVELLRRS